MRRSLSRRALECWTVGMVVLSNIPTVQLCAQQPPLNAGALFLVFPVGAQAVGMGQTATPAAGRGAAQFRHPARPAAFPDGEFLLHRPPPYARPAQELGADTPYPRTRLFGGAGPLFSISDL